MNEYNEIKVCHMTSVHPTEDIRIFHKECIALAERGYKVFQVAQGETYTKSGVKIIGFGEPSKNRISRFINDARKVYRIARNLDCDIYQIHDPELLPYALKLKKHGKKVIFDSHEMYSMQIKDKNYLPKPISEIIGNLYPVYENHVLKRIDGVISPCKYNGENPFDGKCRHTALVNNVPSLDELEISNNVPYKERKPLLCYVGGIRTDRGITEDVKAANITGINAEFGGHPTSEAYLEELKRLDEKKVVNFPGRLDRKQVADLLSYATIGMVTELNVGQNNMFDNLPTKAYEYMAAGLPVIISKSQYVDWLLKEYTFGISVNPGSVQEIVNAINFLVKNKEKAEEMGKTGRKVIESIFNWDIEKNNLYRLYDEIIEEQKK